MKFCANCGAAVVRRVPPGDTLERWVCEHCGDIHYQNPKLVVGTVTGANAPVRYPTCDTLLNQPCRPDAFAASDPSGQLNWP